MVGSDAPTIIGARISGTVTAFDFNIGLGDIESLSGQRWIFHCTQIADGTRDIDTGKEVTFVIRSGAPGRWEACDIQPR